eukprot:1826507-Ditylum_brightwellii.AAC.1
MTEKAAHKNFCILQKFNLYLGKALKRQDSSALEYGLEFREVEKLAKIFRQHPNWDRLKNLLVRGSLWQKEDLDEEERQKD